MNKINPARLTRAGRNQRICKPVLARVTHLSPVAKAPSLALPLAPLAAGDAEQALPVVGGEIAAEEVAVAAEGAAAVHHAVVVDQDRLTRIEAQLGLERGDRAVRSAAACS